MKKLNLLSKAEMKNVLGGIIDGDTTYEVCLHEYDPYYTGNPLEDEVLRAYAENFCSNFTSHIA